jgi:cell wall assembly regulator SMI1
MKQAIQDRLDELFVDEPFMKAGRVDEVKVDAAQEALGVVFSEDYRQFLKKYGGALVGPLPVYGVARAEPMDEELWSVVAVTRHFREQSWPGVEQWYVISMDHAGNPIGIDKSGKVLTYDHDAGVTIELAEDFERYLERCLSKL